MTSVRHISLSFLILLRLLADIGEDTAIDIEHMAVDGVGCMRGEEHGGTSELRGIEPAACGGHAHGGLEGKYNAVMCFFPFTTSGTKIVCKSGNNTATGWIQCPVNTGNYDGDRELESYGEIVGGYGNVEVRVPRNLIGNPTGTIKVNHSYNWGVAGEKSITLAATE